MISPRIILLAFLFLFPFCILKAQVKVADSSISTGFMYASYAFQFPGGDLGDRFGTNSAIGGGFLVKTKSNWVMGGEFNYIFGSDIKIEDELFSNLKTADGRIIDQEGNFGVYSLFERGYYISARFGKIFQVFAPNPNSGIIVTAGAGMIQHKIRIEVPNNSIPQLDGDYKRGYDRLTRGFMVNEFVGYMYLGNRRLVNFFGGIEMVQGFTGPVREYNFDTMKPDAVSDRFDLLWGIRIGWIIPLYGRPVRDYYFH